MDTTQGPVSGFGLAATEKRFPGKPFEGFLTKGGDADLATTGYWRQ